MNRHLNGLTGHSYTGLDRSNDPTLQSGGFSFHVAISTLILLLSNCISNRACWICNL